MKEKVDARISEMNLSMSGKSLADMLRRLLPSEIRADFHIRAFSWHGDYGAANAGHYGMWKISLERKPVKKS